MNRTNASDDMFYAGQRMSIRLAPGVTAHEINDTGGILYHVDGTRTSWRRADKRMTCPDWMPWDLVDWSKLV